MCCDGPHDCRFKCSKVMFRVTQLDGADVRVPTEPMLLKYWPPAELFLFREAKYDEYTVKRHQLAQDQTAEAG